MKTNELIEENTQLQQLLTKTNEKYYANLVIYVRTMSLFRDEEKSEALLLEILQDILEAQEKGDTAEEYFGKNPKQIANEIIHNLSLSLSDTLKIILYGLGSFLLFTIFSELTFPTQGFDIGSFLFTSVYAILFAVLLLYFLGYSVYHYQSKLIKVLFTGIFILGVAIGVGLRTSIATSWKIDLSGSSGIFIIGISLLCLTYLFYKVKNKKLWVPFIPIVLISAVSGILFRSNSLYAIFPVRDIEISVAIALICGLLLQGLLLFINLRKQN